MSDNIIWYFRVILWEGFYGKDFVGTDKLYYITIYIDKSIENYMHLMTIIQSVCSQTYSSDTRL